MIATPTEIGHFIELFNVRHFTKAAIRLGVTQPTLTQSILRLEEKLECRLFHRTKQGCVPTKEGEKFYPKAQSLTDLWSEVSADVRAVNTSLPSGRFKIGCHASVGAYTLPGFIKNLTHSAPEIDVSLHHDFSRKIVEKVISFELDLGFAVNPYRHPDLILKKIGSDRVTFWKKAHLNGVPKKIFADIEIRQVETLLGRSTAKSLKSWRLVQTGSLELIRTLVLSGAGVGILPERVARADGARVEIYDPKFPIFEDEIYVVYRADTLRSAAGKAVIAAAQMVL